MMRIVQFYHVTYRYSLPGVLGRESYSIDEIRRTCLVPDLAAADKLLMDEGYSPYHGSLTALVTINNRHCTAWTKRVGDGYALDAAMILEPDPV